MKPNCSDSNWVGQRDLSPSVGAQFTVHPLGVAPAVLLSSYQETYILHPRESARRALYAFKKRVAIALLDALDLAQRLTHAQIEGIINDEYKKSMLSPF